MQKKLMIGLSALVVLAGAFFLGYEYRLSIESGAVRKLNKVYEMLNEPTDVTGGSIKAISGNTVTIEKTDPLSRDTTVREISINSNTILEKMIFKSDAEKAADLAAYRAKLERATSTAAVPIPTIITRKKINLTDLRVGDFIDVTAASKIGSETKLEAVKIVAELPHPKL